MNLTIVYRAYAGETDGKLNPVRPPWFDKFKCFKSFINEFGEKSKIIVLWDGEEMGVFYDYLKCHHIEIRCYGKIGNKGTLLKTYDILKEENTDIVCAWEDDYLVRGGCHKVVMEGFKMGCYMLTPYEHMDRYDYPQLDVSYGREYIYIGEQNYWRSVESTTGSCFFRKDIYDSLLYSKLLEHHVNDRSFFREMFSKNIRLFSPMPGYATHLCIDRGINLMSPFVDWQAVNGSIVL